MSALTTTCPHCGFDSEDDELCRSCGELIDDSTPASNVSLTKILGGGLVAWLKKEISPQSKDPFEDDLDFDPGWSILSTNIYHDDEE